MENYRSSNHTNKKRRARLAALGIASEIPTPEGEAKMSAIILQLAGPLLERHGKTARRSQAIISLPVAGWNKSIFPADKKLAFEKGLIDSFVPKGGEAETDWDGRHRRTRDCR